ncbi:uncharacterized protein METZ01_LOCUS467967 [marine metagenome]|uniref:Uncharacterized protein n=1 Tax=marine metagenome TaxID=408172 RepID=A0A383B5M3_9ZZZZ
MSASQTSKQLYWDAYTKNNILCLEHNYNFTISAYICPNTSSIQKIFDSVFKKYY